MTMSIKGDISIIAEVGSVHDGSFGNACKLIELAAACGADVVKFQTHIAAAETLVDAPMPHYFKGEPRFAYFERTAFDKAQLKELKAVASKCGIEFLSSPFSLEAVDLLEDIGVDSYKIPSGEVTNIPLLEHIARTGKKTFLSSGMSDWIELDAAVNALRPGGPLYVLQCTSAYPCPPERVGLNILAEMKERYKLPVGFSDHTHSAAAAFAAVACGAVVVEKHLTFSRQMYGSDAANAMEPDEFRLLCTGLREIAQMNANPVNKGDVEGLREMKRVFEKSIVTAVPVNAGAKLGLDSLAYKKPGDGIPAARFRELIGKTVTRALSADHKITWDDVRD